MKASDVRSKGFFVQISLCTNSIIAVIYPYRGSYILEVFNIDYF